MARRLRVHLRPLERDLGFDIWDDTRIGVGSKWREEIERSLKTTRVAVLLVSADFLASDFIATDELPPLLKAAKEDGAIILPVILSPSRYSRIDFLAQFQSVNSPAQPLISMSQGDQEAIFVRIADSIETVFQSGSTLLSQKSGQKPRIIVSGQNGPIVFELNSIDTVIGRVEGNICFPKDDCLSARHARLIYRGQNFTIIDENSYNGIYKQVRSQVELKDGDIVLVGAQSLRVVCGSRGEFELYIIEADRDAGRTYKLNSDEIVIGRTSGQIQFPNDEITSPRHARITRREERFFIMDEQSSCGTFIKIRGQADLSSGDTIMIGSQLIKFLL